MSTPSSERLRLSVLPELPTDDLCLDYLASGLIAPFAGHTTARKQKWVSTIVVLTQ
jgi:hypothetical protein